jgi:DNA polymerase-3 subunit alpha
LQAYCAPPEVAAVAPSVPVPSRGPRGGERDGGRDGRAQRQPVHIPNGLNVSIVYRSEHAEGEVRLGDAWRVKPTDDLITALRGEFAGSSIEIVY